MGKKLVIDNYFEFAWRHAIHPSNATTPILGWELWRNYTHRILSEIAHLEKVVGYGDDEILGRLEAMRKLGSQIDEILCKRQSNWFEDINIDEETTE